MANLAYYLGPWQWATEDDSFWRAPAGTRGLVDLRSLPTQAQAGTLGDRPHGFFAVDPLAVLSSDYTLLGIGDCREIAADAAMRDAWHSLLGYRPSGEKLVDLLWDQLTNGSDPTGDTPVLPLMPGVDLKLKLYLGGHSQVKSAPFHVLASTPHADKVRTLLQRQYAANLEALGDQASRVLDYWCEKYRLNKSDRSQWERLVPPNLRREARLLPHATTITESFNTADSDTLGPDLTWAEVAGDLDVVSNAAQQPTSQESFARAETDLSSDDHYSQIVLTTAGSHSESNHECLARFDSAAETFYRGIHRQNTSNTWRLFSHVTGTATQIGSTVNEASPGVPVTLRVTADGSSISFGTDSVEKVGPVTSTSITGNLRCGFGASGAGSGQTFDNFEAADLSASAESPAWELCPSGVTPSGGTVIWELGPL